MPTRGWGLRAEGRGILRTYLNLFASTPFKLVEVCDKPAGPYRAAVGPSVKSSANRAGINSTDGLLTTSLRKKWERTNLNVSHDVMRVNAMWTRAGRPSLIRRCISRWQCLWWYLTSGGSTSETRCESVIWLCLEGCISRDLLIFDLLCISHSTH